MRKLAVVAVLAVLVVGAVAAPSAAGKQKKKKKERTVEEPYVGPVIGASGAGLMCEAEPLGCVRFEIEPGERFVTLKIEDALGQPVYASVYIFGYSDGTDTHDHICGESADALPLNRGLEELVVIIESTGGATSGCPGPPSTGSIIATFSNKP